MPAAVAVRWGRRVGGGCPPQLRPCVSSGRSGAAHRALQPKCPLETSCSPGKWAASPRRSRSAREPLTSARSALDAGSAPGTPSFLPLPPSPREGDFTPACCARSPVLPGGPSTAGVSGGLLSETCWALASAHWPCGRVPGNEDWGGAVTPGAVRQTRSRLLPWGLSKLLGVHLRLRR